MVRRHRWWAIGGFIVSLIVVTLILASVLLTGPLKRYAEDQAAQRLADYDVRIGSIHIHPFRLALEVNDVIVRQRAHPEPPLATIPSLVADARFLPLLTGTLDLDLRIDRPALSATGEQVDKMMHTEDKEEIKEEAAAWQDTIRGMLPVRLSLSISQGEITYTSKPSVVPIHIEQFEIVADNVTNRTDGDDMYPSVLRVSGRLPDQAELALNGRADFLAKPDPRVKGEIQIKHFSLTNLMPVSGQYNVQLQQGALDVIGHVQHSGNTTVIDINQFTLEGVKADYVHSAQTKQKEAARAKKGAEKVKEAHQDPTLVLKVTHGKILHSDVGFINKASSPDYRVFFSDLDLDVDHFSNRPEEGMGQMTLTGKFMGSGPTTVTGSFRPEKPNPDFDLHVRIVKTQVQTLNQLLRAHGQLDTTGGTFAFFSEMTVKNNHIDGYVKPFLKDVEVYDPEQDKDKAASHKMYEAVVGGVLALFTNSSTGQVVTETSVTGPVENPKEDTWQIIGKLVQNAFFKAILPGFAKSIAG